MFKWLGGLVGSNERELKRLQPTVAKINSLEPDFERLTDAELRAKTDQFKNRLEKGESLDELLPEAFTAVRETAKRTIGQRHFDVQLMGGIVLHQGKVAEMKTGEGKTLVATLPLYLNALSGKGCHLVTVNDYLAKRDPYWMGPIYYTLGVSVASIQHEVSYLYDPEYESDDPRWHSLRPISRRQAYQYDITYGTNNEFGFDYLRDNMVADFSQYVQCPLNYAIVDEVDNILIDEARTPLIISGPSEEPTKKYYLFARIATQLRRDEDYTIAERERAVSLTDNGISKVEKLLRKEGLLKSPSIYDPGNYLLTHYMENALKARALFKRDRDYVVKDGQVIIVDEFTGRLMFGRRYSEGLHQAIEAKEGVKIQRESITLATITLQNYFRMYQKLAGMTGTAATEAEELHKIYHLDVVVIPTNKPMIRDDERDLVYRTEKAKFQAVADEIAQLHQKGQPVLIGTTSIENSEYLSELLNRQGVSHQVLNAKHHEREAAIIAQAGRLGAVTVATHMAGRGVDIILGGNPEGRGETEWLGEHQKVVDLGGLRIIGTERNEARRIDNQLRGRSGRQGDPGSSRFYVSLEDDIMRRFGGDRIGSIMDWAKFDEDTPIEHSLINKAIENAQVKVEGYHFDVRKHLVEYDDVVNKQREVIYAERKKLLGNSANLKENVQEMIKDEIQGLIDSYFGSRGDDEEIDLNGFLTEVGRLLPLSPEMSPRSLSQMVPEEIETKLISYAESVYQDKEEKMGAENMRLLERLVMLRAIDTLWIEHLTIIEQMRQGIGLQAVGHTDPLVAYKKEGHALFESLLANIRHDVAHTIYRADLVKKETRPQPAAQRKEKGKKKIGRNDPCPCGSGKKYKNCCGRGL
jgi:preprotein translocase subunit SecA